MPARLCLMARLGRGCSAAGLAEFLAGALEGYGKCFQCCTGNASCRPRPVLLDFFLTGFRCRYSKKSGICAKLRSNQTKLVLNYVYKLALLGKCLYRRFPSVWGSASVRAGGFTADPREVSEVANFTLHSLSKGKLHPELRGSWGLPWVCPNLPLEGGSAAAETPRAQPCSGAVRACRGDGPRA